ncbi:MAG: hypothetical protein WA776_17440 [Xanthobacteraceae bacterium]
MPAVAQLYGQAIPGAIFDMLDVGFSGNPAPLTPSGNGTTKTHRGHVAGAGD